MILLQMHWIRCINYILVKMVFGKYGADPSNPAVQQLELYKLQQIKHYLIGILDETGGYSVCELNFGNGYFGTTAVSSAGTNASGMEYLNMMYQLATQLYQLRE